MSGPFRPGVLLLSVVMMMMDTTRPLANGPSRLFEFASASAAAEWQAVNDVVMGGISDGRVRITAQRTLEFSGTLSLENNGGFASVRSVPRPLGLAVGDTLVAKVLGDGRSYHVNLYTTARARALSHRATFATVTGEWIEVRVPLDAFVATSFGRPVQGVGPVEPARVTSVGFLLSDKTPGPFRLEVAWIGVVRGDRPAPTLEP